MYAYNSQEVFFNLRVKYWILVHFNAENGGILYWVPKYKVNELSIYAQKSGGQKALLDPALEKVGVSWPRWPRAAAVYDIWGVRQVRCKLVWNIFCSKWVITMA